MGKPETQGPSRGSDQLPGAVCRQARLASCRGTSAFPPWPSWGCRKPEEAEAGLHEGARSRAGLSSPSRCSHIRGFLLFFLLRTLASLPFPGSGAQTALSAPNPDFSPRSSSVAGMTPTGPSPWPPPAPLPRGAHSWKGRPQSACDREEPPPTPQATVGAPWPEVKCKGSTQKCSVSPDSVPTPPSSRPAGSAQGRPSGPRLA